MMTIAYKYAIPTLSLQLTHVRRREKMKLPANVVDQLIQGVNSDIRQVLNMMSTWKLSSNTMDFDESKALYAGHLSWLRYIMLTIFSARR